MPNISVQSVCLKIRQKIAVGAAVVSFALLPAVMKAQRQPLLCEGRTTSISAKIPGTPP